MTSWIQTRQTIFGFMRSLPWSVQDVLLNSCAVYTFVHRLGAEFIDAGF